MISTPLPMPQLTSTVSLYRSLKHQFQDDADDRQRMLTLRVIAPKNDPEEILEWLFAATNAPESLLDAEQMFIRQSFVNARLYSISRGDVIMLDDVLYKCKMAGWEEVSSANEFCD
jgi:hypothetical protein